MGSPAKAVRVLGEDGRIVCTHCAIAASPLTRLRGLLGRRGLADGEGLLLCPCGSVHTAFMRFALDAAFLEEDGRVARVVTLAPWRSASCRGARAVLELRAGAGVQIGERLVLA